MLGIKDPWILTAYLLCILSTLTCVIYGCVYWNKGSENEPEEFSEDAKWEKDDLQVEETL
jgi:hypothetical protein